MKGALAAGRQPFAPGQYAVEGRRVTCPHCEGVDFAEGSAQLNTAGMTFLDLDWANKSAHTLMCAQCSRTEWFGQAPERL
ncbi:MAG: hypothetical protein KKA32_04285 [Actinobacteria bacterium]|nr:hypothetical protein [Actinomycetota bacterium]